MRTIGLLSPSFESLSETTIDITAPRVGVQVQIDRKASGDDVLWVNVDGVCVLRVCQAHIEVIDQR